MSIKAPNATAKPVVVYGPDSNEFANKVKSKTERTVLLAVRSKFSTLPALAFAEWLDQEVERVHR